MLGVLAGYASLAPIGLCDASASGASSTAPASPSVPRFAPSGPDAEAYGASDGYPIGDRSTYFRTPFLVGSYSHLDQVFEGRLVRRATTPSPLARVASEPAVRYEYQGHTFTLDDYLTRHPATGLLVARGNTILIERYQYARHDRHRFASWSMAKTVTAMLVGSRSRKATFARWTIPRPPTYPRSLAPSTDAPRSGICCRCPRAYAVEEYSGLDHVWRLATNTFQQGGAGGVDAVTPFNGRAAPSGTKFAYASVEAQVLGLVLRAVVGRPVADYLHEKIWEPMGAEADATWLIDRTGQEATYCCLNAVLRDYARLGLLLAHDGHWRGQQLITWIEDATRVHPDQAPPARHRAAVLRLRLPGLALSGERRMFALLGVRGQALFVDPASRLVMVHTAVRKQPRSGRRGDGCPLAEPGARARRLTADTPRGGTCEESARPRPLGRRRLCRKRACSFD